MNFVKKIFLSETDDSVHKHFIRFGKGEYNGRFILNLWQTKKTKVKTSFEFANDLVSFCSQLGNVKVSGIISSKQDISNIMSENSIEGSSETKKGIFQNTIPEQELSGEQLKELIKEAYFTLLDIEGDGFQLKIKKKLPKPGKSEEKIDDKFCQLEIEEKYHERVKEDFFWDLPNVKKARITHSLNIMDIIYPKNEKDFAKIRELAKRKGKITRKITIDGNETSNQKDFEA